MTPEQIDQAYNELQSGLAAEDARVQADIGAGAQARSGGVGYVGGGVGEYNRQRFISPVVNPLKASLATAGKSAMLNKIAQDTLNSARKRYQNSLTPATPGGSTAPESPELEGYEEVPSIQEQLAIFRDQNGRDPSPTEEAWIYSKNGALPEWKQRENDRIVEDYKKSQENDRTVVY